MIRRVLNRVLPILGTWLPPLAVFVASLALYVSTLAPGMLGGDSGEFQWAMASLNVAHATGYPLFTLLGYGWLQVPLDGTTAWRLNLVSAIFGACAVTATFVFARALTRRLVPALAAAVFLALAPVFWLNASILEVYTLNAFFLVLILYLVWRWSEQPPETRSDRPLYLAFFVVGLALAHHRMTILIAPALGVFFVLVDRRFFFNWKRLLLLALLTLPGLATYIYVPVRLVAAGATLDYALYDIVLGHEFAGSLRLYPQPLYVLAQVPAENFHIGLALALVGAVTLFRRSRNLAVLLLLVYVVDVAFALFYSVPDVEVFLTPSFVVIALWIAVGANWLLEWLGTHLRAPLTPRLAAVASLVILLLSGLTLVEYDSVYAQVLAQSGGKEERARAILGSPLPNGSLLELDWEMATAIRFIQTTEKLRPDLEARLIKINTRDEYYWVLGNVDTGRPVYVESGVKWVRAPAGYQVQSATNDLVRLARTKVSAQPVKGAISERVQLAALQSSSQRLMLYWQTSQPLERDLATFIHFFDVDGQPLGQEDHGACCEALYGYRTSEWDPGRTVAETFRPAPDGATYLQVGMYALNGDDLQPYGRTVYLQVKGVQAAPAARPLGIELGDQVVVRAYELSGDDANLRLVLYWGAKGTIGQDYTTFVHLLDASGKIVGQGDRPPLGGVYPTSAWQPGQLVRDTYTIPANSAGVKLEFGLYDPATGKRLPRADGSGDTVTVEVK